MGEIDWKFEFEQLEKNYKDLEKVRKTSVIEDTRVLVERIQEHKKIQNDSIEAIENQSSFLQQQYNDMIKMREQIDFFDKKIQERILSISIKDKILKILLQHEKFFISFVSKGCYIVKVLCSYEPTFTLKLNPRGVEYMPQKGFAKEISEKLREPSIISLQKLASYCDEIENAFVDQK